MQEILAAGDKLSDAWVSRGSLWGPSVPAGYPLHVSVQVPALPSDYYHVKLFFLQQSGTILPFVMERFPQILVLQASNSTSSSQFFDLSVSCHDGSHLRGRFEGAFDTSSAMAAGQVSGELSFRPRKCWPMLCSRSS